MTYTCVSCNRSFPTERGFKVHKARSSGCHVIDKEPEMEMKVPSKTPVMRIKKPKSAPEPLKNMKFIDLFCGIGGFHCALKSLGAECVLASDIDEKCRKTYETNWGIKPVGDITALESKDIPDFDILCGGFPCQAFSHAGKQGGFEDTRGTLFREIVRILKDKQPRYFILENVKNLKNHDNGRTLRVIYSSLKSVGYTMHDDPICLSPHYYGIPQHRERIFILGVRNDLVGEKKLVEMKKPSVSLKSSIYDILEDVSVPYPELEIPKHTKEVLDKWEELIIYFKGIRVKLPSFPIWTEYWIIDDSMEKEIKKMPKWKQSFISKNREFFEAHQSFLHDWFISAKKLKEFYGAKSKLEWQCGGFKNEDSLWNLLFTFRPSGIRIKRIDYSPALVAMAQIVYVGSRHRKLSPREVARLQSYPDTFKLHASANVAYKQFGNSVNVHVIKQLATFIVTGMLESQ